LYGTVGVFGMSALTEEFGDFDDHEDRTVVGRDNVDVRLRGFLAEMVLI
jgi:hypothetical protein